MVALMFLFVSLANRFYKFFGIEELNSDKDYAKKIQEQLKNSKSKGTNDNNSYRDLILKKVLQQDLQLGEQIRKSSAKDPIKTQPSSAIISPKENKSNEGFRMDMMSKENRRSKSKENRRKNRGETASCSGCDTGNCSTHGGITQ